MGCWVQARRAEGKLDSILAQHLDERIRELIDYQGACERILKTPIPFNYAVHIKQFLTLYLFTLPFVLIPVINPGFKWLSLPIVLLIGFALSGIEEAGVEVEDPFGTDPNDLPLESICSTIERDLTRLSALCEPPGPE
jgi:ion channel-forming bestrophin family protein